MEEIKINIRNITSSNLCWNIDDAQKVFGSITKIFNKEKKVILSFANIDEAYHSFLNIAIGQLYRDYSEDFIKKYLSVEEISDIDLILLKRVVSVAKQYYKNPGAMEQSIKDIQN